ncbi:MAG: hypothetical protein K0R54_1800, partial [Clostridiaceae bacterium]|nr:hypothetical protein [Clostridiaceae bacterium]
ASFKNAGINVPIAERIAKGYFENYDFIRYVVSNSQYKFSELSNIGVYQLGTNVIGTFDSETGLLTISGTGAMTNFNNSNDSPYYYIGDKIKSVVIEEGVTSIGKYAFYYNFNNLETVTIADTVLTIEDNAFAYCNKLISIVIPNSVTKIGGGAFANCQNLSMVTIGSSVASIGVSAFYDCRNLAEIINLYKGNQTIDISSYASFYNAGYNINPKYATADLVNTNFINAITSRGYKVNETANWGNFVLGTNVAGTFNAETGVLTISGTGNMTNFSGNNAPYNFIKYKITSVVIEEGVTSIGNYAFNGLFILTSITIPNSVTSIGDYAFNGCVKLSSVVLPANLTNLGGNAFNNCDSLSTINIPNSLTTIRYNTFYDCDNLTSVNIPNSVTNIGEYAFYSCDNLAEITNLYKGNQIIDRYAFTGAGSNVLTKQANSFLENYNFNNAITSAGYILNGVETVGTYKLGTNVTGTLDITTGILTISGTGNMNDYNSINQPFYPVRDKIKTVIIEEGVTNVGNNTFYAFKNLTSITIANTVKIIRSSAFYDCDGLTTIVFPNSLTSIEYSAFKECDNITSITIPGSVTTIGSDAFSECDNLVEIINEYTGNQTIGTNVFTNSGLNKPSKNARGYYENINFVNAIINAGYTFEGLLNIGVYQLGTNVIGTFDAETGILTISGTGDMTDFLGINTPYYSIGNLIKTVIIQEGVTSIGDNAFYNNFINLTSIIIPETVTKIGSNAFYKSGIASIIIPNSVLTISSSAFNECDGLISITIPSSVVTIGSGAFANCDNLAEIINMYQGNQSIVNVFTNSGKNASTKIGKAYFENLNGIKSFINAGYTFEELSNIGVYQLGVNVIGTLDSDTGIFTISGTGNMNDMVFNFDNRVTNAPYFEIKEKIKHVIVETGVTRVGKFAFYECDNILTVSFAETVISIGGGAFFSNDKLEEINFSEGLTTIDNAHVEVYSIWECNGICWSSKYQAFYGAFRDSKSLTSVTFPSSLSNIGSYAFGGAVNLASINNLYNGEQTVETSAFVDAGKSLTEKTATVYTINTTFSSYIEGIGYTLNLLEYQDVIDPVINLSANITALTNQNVIVTALVTDNEEIAVKKWAKGLQNAEYFMSSGNELQETFTVSENGTYSIYAKDTNENVTIKTITINNIDKILPTAPTIKIILGKLVITHGTDSGSGVNDSKYQINDGEWTIYVGQVALVDGEYIINAKTTDKVGNESSIATSNTVIYETALNNAKNAVSQAETTKEQIDIDNARTLVNVLPETELIKSSLIERLDMVQKYINNKDTLAEATNAVALAKITKLQDDIDNAFALVNSLSDSIEKTYLLEQLNNVQRYIDIKKALEELINNLKNRVVPFANIASLKIEMPMYLTSSVNIKTFMINKLPLATIVDIDVLLNSLPEGEDKAYLKALNSLVNNSNDFITQILIGDMVIAETTINTINADVVNLPEGEDKVTFIEIAHELTLIFNAMKLDTVEAIAELPNTELKNEIIVDKIQDAITIAEETNNQEDVNEANEWINILPDSHESKETLTQEIEVIQEIVDIKEQIQEVIRAIEQAEETKLPEDINKAQELISNLPDNQYTETIKPSLEERVNTIPVDYLALAIQAVEKAERTHIQTDLDYARILVNNLLDNIIEKISLNERLDILQIYINKVKIATQSVKKAEMSKLQTDVDNARIYVNELIEPEITDLGKRLDAVQIYIYYKIEVLPQDIDTINGFLDVINLLLIENYEQAQVKLNEVKIIIETIIDIDSKSQMTLNAQRLQNVINAGNSIILAENTLMQNDYNIANASVGSLPDTKFKVNLLTRLNNLQAIINAENELQQAIANTTNAVVKAEGSKLQADVNSARALVNALPQIAEKTSLTERLNAVQSMIDIENELQQAIANATNAVVKAEGSKLQTDVDSARVLVNGLPNSEVKTSLNGRLDTVQAIIDAEKELQQIIANATNAVIKAEGSKLQADVDNARALVNALSNSEKKTSLTERLNSIQVIVDNPGSGETNTAEAIKNAETKVKIAEAYKRNPYLTDAEEVVNALYDSPKKTALLDRLEALKEKIEENAIAQELKNATTKVKIAETYKREPYISTARDTVNALIDSPEKEALDDRLDAIVPIDGSGSSSTVIKYANNAVLRAEKTPTKYTILYAIKRVNMIADGTPEKADLLQRVETLKTNYNNLIAEKNAIRQINNATNYVNYAEKYKSTYYFNKAEALVNALENGEIKTTLLNRLEVLRPIIFPSAEAVAIQEATKAVEKAEKYKIEVYIQNARTLVNALADSEIKTTLSDRLDLIIVE